MALKSGQKDYKNMGKSSLGKDLTGVMVLALGVSAVLGVGIYGAIKYFKNRDAVSIVNAEPGNAIEEAIARDAAVLAQKMPAKPSEMMHPDFEALKGSWKLTYGVHGVAVLTVADDFFQITMTSDPTGAQRTYSRGFFEYTPQDGKLSLVPSPKAGEPEQITGVQYKSLTQRAYDVYLSQKQGDPALYFAAPQQDVAGKTYHPMFLFIDYNGAPVLKWEKVQ